MRTYPTDRCYFPAPFAINPVVENPSTVGGCRKPLPSLVHQAQAEFPGIAAESSAIVCDSWSDIEFGHRLGMLTVFIDGDPEFQKRGAEAARDSADLHFPSLATAVDAILTLHPA